jgi:hypothetical protein
MTELWSIPLPADPLVPEAAALPLVPLLLSVSWAVCETTVPDDELKEMAIRRHALMKTETGVEAIGAQHVCFKVVVWCIGTMQIYPEQLFYRDTLGREWWV